MEVDTFTVTTPTQGGSPGIHTPPAPIHGFSDSWEPYSPRKSVRLSQRVANRTPSPQVSSRRRLDHHRHSNGSPKSISKSRVPRQNGMMASPATSPRKKQFDSSRRAPGSLITEGAAAAAQSLGLTNQPHMHPGRASISAVGGMLITPAKTPQKPPTEESKAKIKEISRNIFSETKAPTSIKKRNQYTLDSFASVNEADETIPIFTDSHERIPEVDRSAENPFYGDHIEHVSGPRRRSKRQQTVYISGEGDVPIEEAVKRKDGMIFTFRGKKTFRKIEKEDAPQELSDAETPRRQSSRLALKPRLLFGAKPTVPEINISDMDEEEATTDIEDHKMAMDTDEPATPTEVAHSAPPTPEAPRFAPASPPTTARSTRFGKKPRLTTPMKGKKATPPQRSPFDGWRRVKSEAPGEKRPGEDLASGSPKRTRTRS